MDSQIEIIIPTFINCHLFWFIPKKNLLLRSAIDRHLRSSKKTVTKSAAVDEMVAVNIDDIWARAIITRIEEYSRNNIQYVCWLPDYGVMRIVNYVFDMPEEMKKCPHLARQASLHDVVNLTTDLVFDGTRYEFKFKKTTSDVVGVKKVALDCIEQAKRLFFSIEDEDEFNVYGDIIFINQDAKEQSLTHVLIKKNLLGVDKELFNYIESSRELFKTVHFEGSSSWHQELDKTERKGLSEIIFNKEVNRNLPPMEFFKRFHFNNELTNRYS